MIDPEKGIEIDIENKIGAVIGQETMIDRKIVAMRNLKKTSLQREKDPMSDSKENTMKEKGKIRKTH